MTQSSQQQRLAIVPSASAAEVEPARACERSLVLVGVNHTTAPIQVRERLAIPAAWNTRSHDPLHL